MPVAFLSLSSEIRQRIYSYTFGYGFAVIEGTPVTWVVATMSTSRISSESRFHQPEGRSSQLLQTCRQVFREARLTFASQTEVVATPIGDPYQYLPAPRQFANQDHIADITIIFHSRRLQALKFAIRIFPMLKSLMVSGRSFHWGKRPARGLL
jgi:hypothetical protein